MPLTIHTIQDAAGLDRLCEHLAAAPRIALDTEFHSERRYRPELLLLQLATSAEEVWLLDPKAIHPAPLGPILSAAEIIIHGGQQDIRILNDATGWEPRKIFDTQIGAGLLGLHYPERLSTLASTLLGLPLDKSPTLTDWTTRPLSRQQRQYAADDAAILFSLSAELEARLTQAGRAAWSWEASAEMAARVLAPPHPAEYWAGWEVATRMAPLEWRTLGALRAWREATAAGQNRPPNAILPNGILIDLARRRPSSRRGLHANRRIHSGFIRHNGTAVLQTIANAEKSDVPTPPTRGQLDAADAIALWARAAGASAGIAPRLLVPDGLQAVIAQEGAEKIFQGWREPFQQPLEKFLSGAAGIAIGSDGEKTVLQVVSSPG